MKEENKKEQDWRYHENGGVKFEYINSVMTIGNCFREFVRDMGEDFFEERAKEQIEKHGKLLWPKSYIAYGAFEAMLLAGKYPKKSEK